MAQQKKIRPPVEVTDIILESISDGVFTVDHEWRITSFNRAAEEITGVPRAEAIGRYCWEVFRANMCEGDCALRRSMQEGRSYVSSSTYIINSERQRIPISVSTAPLRNEAGEIIGGVETFRDNTVVDELRRELSGSQRQGDMVSSQSPDAPAVRHPAADRRKRRHRADRGRDRHRQGAARPAHLHDLSPRRDRPFVAINCGALPDTLLGIRAVRLQGRRLHRAPSGTSPAASPLAEGGTILLDEIGETSPALQVKLLRVLQEREFRAAGRRPPVSGSTCASSRPPTGIWRPWWPRAPSASDLFYRINVVRLELPPLRARREDIPLLVERFIGRMNRLRGRTVVRARTRGPGAAHGPRLSRQHPRAGKHHRTRLHPLHR